MDTLFEIENTLKKKNSSNNVTKKGNVVQGGLFEVVEKLPVKELSDSEINDLNFMEDLWFIAMNIDISIVFKKRRKKGRLRLEAKVADKIIFEKLCEVLRERFRFETYDFATYFFIRILGYKKVLNEKQG